MSFLDPNVWLKKKSPVHSPPVPSGPAKPGGLGFAGGVGLRLGCAAHRSVGQRVCGDQGASGSVGAGFGWGGVGLVGWLGDGWLGVGWGWGDWSVRIGGA